MRLKQDRSRKSGHAHSKNIQDYGQMALSIEERALHYFRNWVKMRPQMTYYDALPPELRAVVDQVGESDDLR